MQSKMGEKTKTVYLLEQSGLIAAEMNKTGISDLMLIDSWRAPVSFQVSTIREWPSIEWEFRSDKMHNSD